MQLSEQNNPLIQDDVADTPNPLVRDGVAQSQRQRPNLSPEHIQVDEKDLADFLLFAHDLSSRITYYETNQRLPASATTGTTNSLSNWSAFFERSTPIQIASISKTRPEVIQQQYEQALHGFLVQYKLEEEGGEGENIPQPSTETQVAALNAILDVYAQILDSLQTWSKGLTEGMSLKATLKASVKTNLPAPLSQLYQLEQRLMAIHQVCPFSRWCIYSDFSDTFGPLVPPVDDYLSAEVTGDSPTLSSPNQVAQALAALVRSLFSTSQEAEFDSLFQPLFRTYRQVIQLAPQALHQSLYGHQTIEPHLALYVAFWEMLKPARADLNRMTERHLNFFYREVLRLSEQPAQPDKAHIILTLARFEEEYRVQSHTPVSAGEDATGADLIYTLDDEIIVNNAQVAEIKGLFLHSQTSANSDDPPPFSLDFLGLHGSPMANSVDGIGGKFPKDQIVKAWLPFGDEQRPTESLGLAIASNILLLKEGDRKLTFNLTLGFSNAVTLEKITLNEPEQFQDFHIDFSGEKDWIRGTVTCLNFSAPEENEPSKEYTLKIEVELPIDTDPVVPYHSKLSGGPLATDSPVARLVLQHSHPTGTTEVPPSVRLYRYLYYACVQAIEITAEVNGVRDFLLQNDLSVLDSTNPFQPFGPQPKVGANFYIGNQEVFQKKLTDLKLVFEWDVEPPSDWQEFYQGYDDVDNNYNPGQLTIQALRKRQWFPMTTDTVINNIFESRENTTSSIHFSSDNIAKFQLSDFIEQPFNTQPLEPWTYESQYGFLRLQLKDDDFLHSQYPIVLARQVLATATQDIIDITEFDSKAKAKAISEDFASQEKLKALNQEQIDLPNTEADAKQRETDASNELQELLLQIENQRRIIAATPEPFKRILQSNLEPLLSLRRQAQADLENAQADLTEAKNRLDEILREIEKENAEIETRENQRKKRKAVVGAYYRRGQTVIQADTHYVERDDVPILPNEPYTPVIKSIKLTYNAKATTENCQLFHLHPFNGVSALPQLPLESSNLPPLTLLPQFLYEGELFIGLQDLEPSTALSMLFQVDEASADTDLERTAVNWYYLVDNTWKQIQDYMIVKDTSNGLIQSGIVRLAIPPDISKAGTTILNPALHWIKASVRERSGAIANIISIQTQAATVTYTEADNDPNHLATPLPAETIANFIDPPPEIRTVQQPYPSFDGKTKEQPAQFYTRISEHLRHKGRAVTIFDYEHLILERFPEIYKVRCINHGQLVDKQRLYEVAPGHVTLAVIPALSQRPTLNELEPKVNINLLAEIEKYIKSLTSPWAKIQVINPRYEQLRVSFKVRFRPSFAANSAFYDRELERAIIGFLSPWTVDAEAEIHFGGDIYRSSILKFVEDQPYVDNVLDFQLFQKEEKKVGNSPALTTVWTSRSRVSAQSAHSILVSVPFSGNDADNHHHITPISAPSAPPPEESHDSETSFSLGHTPLSELTLEPTPGE